MLFDLTLAVSFIDGVCVQALLVCCEPFKLDFPTTGEQLFNNGKDNTWGDDKDGENDWLSSALAQRLA